MAHSQRAARFAVVCSLLLICWVPLTQARPRKQLDSPKQIGDVKLGRYKTEKSWLFIPGVNVGYNKLIKGYEGYGNLGNAGLDLYIRPPRETADREEWNDNLLLRFSLDYFPLQVPKGTYGLKEDMYSFNTALIYQFHRLHRKEMRYIPFAGLGFGLYKDVVTLNTPASGGVRGSHRFFGYQGSVGMFLPVFKAHFQMRLVPEIRYHRVNVLNGTAVNMTYQVSLLFWPAAKE